MALNPSNSSNLKQLALKELKNMGHWTRAPQVYTFISSRTFTLLERFKGQMYQLVTLCHPSGLFYNINL